MVRGFGKVFTFFCKGFSKDRTLQEFKGDTSTLLLLMLILSVTFSCHE